MIYKEMALYESPQLYAVPYETAAIVCESNYDTGLEELTPFDPWVSE